MRFMLGATLLVLASCRVPAAPSSQAPSAAKPTSVPPSAAPELIEAPPLAVSESAIKAIAIDWCENGGEQFLPPGQGDPDDFPPPLENCDDITIETVDDRTASGVRATLYRLEAPLEGRDILLVSTPSGTSQMTLEHRLDDTSGEMPETYTDYDGAALEDVYDDATPEWIVQKHYEEGDNYEADRCYENGVRRDVIIICALSPAIECAAAVFASESTSAPRKFLDDCEDPPSEDEALVSTGFETTVEVQRDVAIFAPTKKVFDKPEEPAFKGRVPIARLFEDG